MSRRLLVGVLCAAGLLLISREWASSVVATAPAAVPPDPKALRQAPADVRFHDSGLSLGLPSVSQPSREVRWSVVGAHPMRPQVSALPPGRQGGPSSESVRYPGVLPGVELRVEARAEGLEYGFRAERGGALRRVQLEYSGVKAARVVEGGRGLEVALAGGALRERDLRCTQEPVTGPAYAVGCRFADARWVDGERWRYAIEVDVVDPERPVVVDPAIDWFNYLGFAGDEALGGMVRVPGTHDLLLTGTLSDRTGTKVPEQGDGARSAVLTARFSEEGVWQGWSALDGDSDDTGRAIAISVDGKNVFIAGQTLSKSFGEVSRFTNWSVTTSTSTGQDGFVARIDPTTMKAQWVYLFDIGGQQDSINDLAVLSTGDLVIVGSTTSSSGSSSSTHAFISLLNTSAIDGANPVVSTPERWTVVLKGTGMEMANAVALDETNTIYVTGVTTSPDLFSEPKAAPAGMADAFIAKLTPDVDGGKLLAGTYFGGSEADEGRDILVRTNSDVLVAGTSSSMSLTGTESAPGNGSRAFALQLGKELNFKGVVALGGSAQADAGDEGRVLAVDDSQRVYLGGIARSTTFPRPDSAIPFSGGEGFVARIEFDASTSLVWSSLVQGSGDDAVLSIASNPSEPAHLYIAGNTTSSNLGPMVPPPAGSAYSSGYGGKQDMFLSRLNLLPDAGDGGDVGNPGDAGTGDADAGNPGDAGTGDADAGTGDNGGGKDRTPAHPTSPLGYSCGSSASQGGPGALALVSLLGLALLAARRRDRAPRG